MKNKISPVLTSQHENGSPRESLYKGENSIENDRIIKLDSTLKNQFERAFGMDFYDVRIHTGQYANELARTSGAAAVTYGTDIYFANGKYLPDTEEGISLLAHELQHVIQYKQGERMLYIEDINSLEEKAATVESMMDSLRLHNIEAPLLDQSLTPALHTDQHPGDSYVALHKKTNPFGDSTASFSGGGNKKLYSVKLSNGNKAVFTEKGFINLMDKVQISIKDWLVSEKIQSSEEEYEKLLISFLEITDSCI